MPFAYHCKEGNLKWVSLILWAAPIRMHLESAATMRNAIQITRVFQPLAYAVLYQHFDIFKLKHVKLDPSHPHIEDVVRYADRGEGIDLLKQLLEKGLKPNDQENGGCSHIQRLLNGMEVDYSSYSWHQRNNREKIDSSRAREKIKAVHLPAKHGARWVPKDNDIKYARRSLLKLTSDFTIEFAWIMSKYTACAKTASKS